jgi:hypothetical protein
MFNTENKDMNGSKKIHLAAAAWTELKKDKVQLHKYEILSQAKRREKKAPESMTVEEKRIYNGTMFIKPMKAMVSQCACRYL